MSNKADAKLETKRGLEPRLRFPEFRDSGVWEKTSLGKISTITSGGTPSRAEPKFWDGKIPWVTTSLIDFNVIHTANEYISDDGLRESSAKIFPKNTILIAMYGQGKTRGKVAILGIEASTNQACAAILLKKRLNTIFVFQNLAGRYEQIRDMSNRGGQENLSAGLIEEIPFSYPEFDEQQKIADCLSSIDELIDAESQKLEQLQTHKKGLMQQLFPAVGKTVPELRFPEFEDGLEWKEKKLGDIATIKSGTTPLRSNAQFFDSGSIAWVKTTDLNNSYIYSTEELITPLAKARINPEDSVLVAMYGGFNQIGRTGYLKIPAATNQAISVLSTNQEEVLPLYLLIWLNAKVETWKTFATSSRKDPNITGSDVANFPISYPLIVEQQKIADGLSSLDELIAAQKQKIELLKIYKKGLMQQLFPSSDEVQE